jgi:hypothetical protein
MLQLLSDMNNVRIRDRFPFSRTNEWVYPSGESLLLDGVFRDSGSYSVALWEKEVFDDKCLPEKGDTDQLFVNRLKYCEMFDEIYVHGAVEEERLSDTTYPQSRRITYGVVHT